MVNKKGSGEQSGTVGESEIPAPENRIVIFFGCQKSNPIRFESYQNDNIFFFNFKKRKVHSFGGVTRFTRLFRMARLSLYYLSYQRDL